MRLIITFFFIFAALVNICAYSSSADATMAIFVRNPYEQKVDIYTAVSGDYNAILGMQPTKKTSVSGNSRSLVVTQVGGFLKLVATISGKRNLVLGSTIVWLHSSDALNRLTVKQSDIPFAKINNSLDDKDGDSDAYQPYILDTPTSEMTWLESISNEITATFDIEKLVEPIKIISAYGKPIIKTATGEYLTVELKKGAYELPPIIAQNSFPISLSFPKLRGTCLLSSNRSWSCPDNIVQMNLSGVDTFICQRNTPQESPCPWLVPNEKKNASLNEINLY